MRPGRALLVALLLAAGGAGAEPDRFSGWIEGDWIDPRVHRCDQVWVRIRVEEGQLRHFTVTFGNAVPGMAATILETLPTGGARLRNDRLGFDQRVRYVTPNAHVLEKANGAGGVTFVRCPEAGRGPAS